MTIAAYIGPTISKTEASTILDAEYLPPVKQGDIYHAVETGEHTALVLIDGVFENTASVWHKEILWALNNGVAVFGAASMGALRASELSPFGMIGSGKIFDALKKGLYEPYTDPFDGDDEVAVLHGPEDAPHLSTVALVDFRETLVQAENASIIDPQLREELFNHGRKVFYKERTWDRIKDIAHSSMKGGGRFADWVDTGRVSQKRLDAVNLLESLSKNPPQPPEIRFRFEWTAPWQRMVEEYEAKDAIHDRI